MKPWKPKLSDFPKGTFMSDWLERMSHVETAFNYDVWTGLWLLSLACGREIYVDRPLAPVHLNMYLVLAAESGVTRKSSAVRAATDVMRSLFRHLPHLPILLEGRTTPETLLHKLTEDAILHEKGDAVIAVSEMVTFFGREKYNRAMPGVLTDLYDCPAARDGGGSITRGEARLRNVWINILTASTPTWLVGAINPDIIEGGFTSRTFFVVDEQRKRPIAWPESASEHTSDSLAKRLADIRVRAKQYRTITIAESALKEFDKWYRTRYTYRDPYRASFDSREDAHVLRIAALLSVNDNRYLINTSDVKLAIKLVGSVKEMGASLFEGTGTNTTRLIGLDRMRDILIGVGKNYVKRSELTMKVKKWMNAAELEAALDIMHELGMIQKFQLAHKGKGRPVEAYRATKLLAARTSISEVATQLME